MGLMILSCFIDKPNSRAQNKSYFLQTISSIWPVSVWLAEGHTHSWDGRSVRGENRSWMLLQAGNLWKPGTKRENTRKRQGGHMTKSQTPGKHEEVENTMQCHHWGIQALLADNNYTNKPYST